MKPFHMKLSVVPILIGMCIIFLTGCKDNPVVPPDPTYLTVVSTSPLSQATSVSINSAITVTFSKSLDASSLTANSFKVAHGDTAVTGSISVNGNSCVFTPTVPLKCSVVYTCRLTSSVSDISHETLQEAYQWSFITASAKDTVGPTVTSVSPTANMTNVSISSIISVTFSEALNSQTLNANTFKITQGNTIVAGNISVNGNVATFSPVVSFIYSTLYTAIVTTSVTDLAGNALAVEYRWSFTTVAGPFTPWYIANTQITEVATDVSGNVYVAGMFDGGSTGLDCFVARFNSDGKLSWRKNIATNNYDYPRGVIVVAGDVVYVNLVLGDVYGLGSGNTFVNAYYCNSGELKWSTKISSNSKAYDLAVDQNGYIYSVIAGKTVKLDQNGSLVKEYIHPSGTAFGSIAFLSDAILLSGVLITDSSTTSLVRKFDQNLNIIWDYHGTVNSPQSGAQSIVSFSGDSLVFVSESRGDVLGGISPQTYIICYRLHASNMDIVWQKLFDNSYDVGIKKFDENSFFVIPKQTSSGPVKEDINGNVLWTANPKTLGDVSFFENKVYVANGANRLLVYNN